MNSRLVAFARVASAKRGGDGDDETFERVDGFFGVLAARGGGAHLGDGGGVSSRDVEDGRARFHPRVAVVVERANDVGGAKHDLGGDVDVDVGGGLPKR